MAHVLHRVPINGPHILAHAEAGERLLSNNPFAISNDLGYRETFAPDHPRQGRLTERPLFLVSRFYSASGL